MNDIWMKAGLDKPAHWIKLNARCFIAACDEMISREKAQRVPVQKVSLANAPGRYFYKPREDKTCPTCEQKAREQA